MKTVYSAEYSAKYDILFRDAFKALMDAGIDMSPELDQLPEDMRNDPQYQTFTSLEEYYTRIGDLAILHSENVKGTQNNEGYSKYSKYLMLPMDEIHGNNVFSIDPNSRAINVPASFSRNGVSVTGDELAETLLFEIDRFFDTTDLVTTDIYVQWTNPKGDEGASKITMVDYNSKPGKLLFGWPLTSRVTVENANQTNGQLKFAVRFFKREGNEEGKGRITYSLNTLPATVTIKQALYTNWNDTLDIDDPAAELAVAIENGPASDGPTAEFPVIYQDLAPLAYLDEGPADEEKTSVNLQVRTVTMDSGIRRYEWTFKPSYIENNAIVLGPSEVYRKKEEYVKTTDATMDTSKKYYKDLGEGGFKTYDPEVDGDFAAAKDNLFEPCSNHFVSWEDGKHVTGTYSVKTYNRVGKSEVNRDSAIVTIPHPTDIHFAENGNLKADEWLTADEEGALVAKPLRVVTAAAPEKTTTVYKWEYADTVNGAMSELMTEADDEGISVPQSVSASLEVKTPGWYRVTATASLNEEELYVVSATSRVLAPIEAPAIYPDSNKVEDAQKVIDINDGEQAALEIQLLGGLEGPLKSDSITYQWFRNKPDENGLPIAVDDADYISGFGTNRLVIKKMELDQFETYYCVVTNHLADKTASTTSAQFTIM